MNKIITILGQTATGKTTLATHLAFRNSYEIISADSRQVYKGMTIGTGKDLDDYLINNSRIPYHLIDICEPGEEYNLHRFVHDFNHAVQAVASRGKIAVLCGGTGLYIHAVLKGYQFIASGKKPDQTSDLFQLSYNELVEMLHKHKPDFDTSGITDKKQLIRAIELAKNGLLSESTITYSRIESVVFGISCERSIVKERITSRLKQRLENGMIEEVEQLVSNGLSFEKLEYYGLEYRYIGRYLKGSINKEELFTQLNIAIHQFSKRQMTFFRKMEKEGVSIRWIDGSLTLAEKLNIIENEVKRWI